MRSFHVYCNSNKSFINLCPQTWFLICTSELTVSQIYFDSQMRCLKRMGSFKVEFAFTDLFATVGSYFRYKQFFL